MPCPACTLGVPLECFNDEPCEVVEPTVTYTPLSEEIESRRDSETGELLDEHVTDIKSTGRKRAARQYPIEEGMICEWAKLRYAGGGVKPIIGCPGNPAVARHHGPDKDTLNNEFGNVHRICVHCHNRFHAENDQYYGERSEVGGVPFLPLPQYDLKPHDRETQATVEEIAENEVYYLRNRPKRAKED